jgi:phosphohistidine phosphatase
MPKSARDAVRYLWLLRHGKAASDAPWGGSDKERPLTARGRRDAAALGQRILKEQPVLGLSGVVAPVLAICSAAVRTRQTAELVVKAMGSRIPIDSYRSLYEADTEVVLQYVREIDESVKSVLVVGHNPTIYQLVWELLGGTDEGGGTSDRATLEAHGFPTCSLAVVTLHVAAWEDAAHGCGNLAGVFKPPY